MTEGSKVKVLIVDDSAIAREMLERGLSLDPGIEVVGKAADVFAARDKIVFLTPDVITLDVEMPKMDGIEFLKRLLPQYPIPVVIVSAVTAEGSRRALEALDAGAVEVVAKPSGGDRNGLAAMIVSLREAVHEAARADMTKLRKASTNGRIIAKRVSRLPKTSNRYGTVPELTTSSTASSAVRRSSFGSATQNFDGIIAIGASTGGTSALHRILPFLPEDLPPVLVVQHMPPVFTRMFAEALDRECAASVKEAEEGDMLERGLILIAPGDFHMRLVKTKAGFMVRLDSSLKVSGHRPSVDVLFSSVAECAGATSIGLLLTGMGRDGANGLLAMRKAGARCIAQDEASSVVFGMPKEAWDNGAAERLVPLEETADELVTLCSQMARR